MSQFASNDSCRCIDSYLKLEIENQNDPHKDSEILRELYHGYRLNLEEVGEILGVCGETVRRWMVKFDIDRRYQPTPGVWFGHDKSAHEMWVTRDGNESAIAVYVAQLVAIADGADPSKVFSEGKVVHHRNGIPFDNRPKNLEVLGRSRHQLIHNGDNCWGPDERLDCDVLLNSQVES
jgi:hypothetical protein